MAVSSRVQSLGLPPRPASAIADMGSAPTAVPATPTAVPPTPTAVPPVDIE